MGRGAGKPGHKELERPILERFCASLRLSGYRNVRILKQRPIDDPPDAELSVDGEGVYVELTAYRRKDQELGPEVEQYDLGFRKEVCSEWLDDEDVNHWFIHLEYRHGSEEQIQVPLPQCRKQLIDELKSLVQEINHQGATDLTVKFSSPDDPPGQERLDNACNLRRVERDQYPTLSRYFSSVRIRYCPGVQVGLPSTGPSTYWGDFDRDQLRRTLDDKLRKLCKYKKNCGSNPIWLLVHADGFYGSARIPPGREREKAVCVLRELADQARSREEDMFDAVWLMCDVGGGCTELTQIFPNLQEPSED